jgi:hypothetical protein
MPTFDINDLSKIGAIRDMKPYMLPPEAWTIALNMRYEDESLKTIEGWKQVFGTPPIAPHFGMILERPAASVLTFVDLVSAKWYDGVTYTDATRTVGGPYTASATREWNGTIAGGGIPILNNGLDVPQYSQTPGTGTFENLVNWPANMRAKVIRAFGPHLVAMNITVAGGEFPHRVHWSHPASPGSLPNSWDETDPTRDAGNYDLPDAQSGLLLNGFPLGSIMYLYKGSSVWRMRYVGGQSKFDFGQSAWIANEGLLNAGSICISGDGLKHIFATTSGDIMWHDGNRVQSALTLRQRRRLQTDIDPANAGECFMFANPFTNSIWFCYPESGAQFPTKALHMCYKTVGGTEWAITEVDGISFRNVVVGSPPGPMAFGVWDEVDGVTWDSDAAVWDMATVGGGTPRRKLILLDPANSKFYSYGDSPTRDGVAFTSTLQRVGLGVLGKKRDGSPIVDFQRRKMITRIFPKITGGNVSIRFNSQQVVDGPVSNGASVNYDPTTQYFADPQTMEGNAVGLEMSGTVPWQIDGYKINIEPLGEF